MGFPDADLRLVVCGRACREAAAAAVRHSTNPESSRRRSLPAMIRRMDDSERRHYNCAILPDRIAPVRHLRGFLLLGALLMLGGCDLVLLGPSGDVARQQSEVMITSTVIIALIIVAVGAISWIGTHQLDPYRPLAQVAAGKPLPPDAEPLDVEVVSLQWKWLFFYPQYGIATVNELAAPVDVPIRFRLTGDTMMDSFFVPALAGQIYTMPGMQTMLHAVINKPGDYKGFSANFSGDAITDMRFTFHGMSGEGFAHWVAKVRAQGGDLDRAAYDRLRQPTRDEPVHYYAHFTPDLYTRILNRCVDPGQTCMSPMMAGDARGGMPMDAMPGHGHTGEAAHAAAMH